MPGSSSVTVVIATHNRPAVLPRAIESVLPQLEERDELVVVDDGSDDDTASVVEGYGDRVHFLRQANQGPGAARNHGMERSSGDYVTFLDDDDEYLPGRLEVLRTTLDRFPQVVYAFTSYRVELPDGTFGRGRITRKAPQLLRWAEEEAERHWYSSFAQVPVEYEDFPVSVGHDYALQMRVDYVGPPFMMVRRSQTGGIRFPTDIWRYEDWEYSARLARLGPVAFLDTDPYLYWIPPDPEKRLMNHDVFEMAGHRLTVLRRVWGRDPEFLKEHRATYEARCDAELVFRAKRLIAHGDSRGAALELAQMSRPSPTALRLLTYVPSSVLGQAMGARRQVKRWTDQFGWLQGP